jgi:hypothetical protein
LHEYEVSFGACTQLLASFFISNMEFPISELNVNWISEGLLHYECT